MNLRKVLQYGILATLLITPFLANYVSDSMFFPFITGKNFAFRILVEIATAMWVVLLFVDKEVRPKFSWILAGAGSFLATLFIADLTGVDPHKSIWSNFERMEGLVTHIHLFLYFLVLSTTLLEKKMWYWLANTWLVASIFVSIGAFRQIFGAEQYYFGSGRVDAGLGNAAYMGIYVVFNVFLAVILWLRTSKENWWRYAYPVFVAVNVYLTFKSQTRGSMLGLFGGAALSVLLIALFDKTRKHLRKYAFGALALFVILTGLFIANRDAAWIKNYPSLNRMASISTKDSTTETRLTIWKMSFEGFKDRPVFGWGQENFIYVFAKHFDPVMYKYEPWYDRSHNVFFDWLIASGAVGLIAYLSLYVGILYYLWFYKKGEKFEFKEKVVITGMVAAYFIHNLFVFDNLVSYMFFFILLAYIHNQSVQGENAINEPKKNEKNGKSVSLDGGDITIISCVVLVVLFAAIYFVNIRDINANKTMLLSLRGNNAVYQEGGKQKLRIKDALEEATIGKGEIREQVISQTGQVMQMQGVPDSLKKEFMELAVKVINETLAENPNDLRMLTSAIAFYANAGSIEKAEEYFNKAIKVSPNRVGLYLDFINIRLSKGNLGGALELATKAIELAPDNEKAKTAYASILILGGKSAEAKKILEPMKGSSSLLDDRLMYAYGTIKAYSEIISVFESLKDKSQMTPRNSLYYAEALLATGRKADSIAVLKQVAEKDPSQAQKIEEYIKSIQ